jgi:uncharacterized membrane protein HdeD (DUF308 family)
MQDQQASPIPSSEPRQHLRRSARWPQHQQRCSLGAVTALVGVAFLYGGVTELAVASWMRSGRWLFIVGGIVALAAGILTFAWPGITLYVVAILLAWYLIIIGVTHLISALAGPKVSYW